MLLLSSFCEGITSQRAGIWEKMEEGWISILASPLPAFLTFGSYVKGLLAYTNKQPIFHRTPKSRRYLKSYQEASLPLPWGIYIATLSWIGLTTDQQFLSAFFISQGLCLMYLGLKSRNQQERLVQDSSSTEEKAIHIKPIQVRN